MTAAAVAAVQLPGRARADAVAFRTDPAGGLCRVPAFNEADNLPRLFSDLECRPSLFPVGSRLIVVDDGSTDGTAQLVEGYKGALPVELLRMERNGGLGLRFAPGLHPLSWAPRTTFSS